MDQNKNTVVEGNVDFLLDSADEFEGGTTGRKPVNKSPPRKPESNHAAGTFGGRKQSNASSALLGGRKSPNA